MDYYQNTLEQDWHGLNDVRNAIGPEIGLPHQDLDQYAHDQDDASFAKKGIMKWMFLEKYSDSTSLIIAIEAAINKNPFDPSFHELLIDIAKKQTSQPEDFVAEHFYTDSYQLTTQAVKAMLKHLGILS